MKYLMELSEIISPSSLHLEERKKNGGGSTVMKDDFLLVCNVQAGVYWQCSLYLILVTSENDIFVYVLHILG